jgi:predicted nucleic acid-binding protein
LTVVFDTSVALALYDAGEPDHEAVAGWLLTLDEDLVTTPLTLTEMDHMLAARGGGAVRRVFWDDLDDGAYGVRWWADGLRETLAIARSHAFLGLADASLVALAGLLRTTRIATLDQHFRSVTTPGGEPFVVLPADA